MKESQCVLGWVCPGGTHLLGHGISGGTPPDMGYNGIRSSSEQYTSYWNAFLLLVLSNLSLGVRYDLRLLHFNNGSMFPKERGEQKKKIKNLST